MERSRELKELRARGPRKTIWLAAVLGVLAVATAVSDAAPSGAAVAVPGTGRIAYINNADGDFEIRSMHADGTSDVALTANSANDEGPAWSPDGTKIAFGSNRGGSKFDIYVMNADGTSVNQVTTTGGASPDWSPDGTRIAYSDGDEGEGEIVVMDADGTNQVQLTAGGAINGGPSWSPDGTRIAFHRYNPVHRRYDVWVINSDGTNEIQLTSDPADDFAPDWSPDGSKIAFGSGRASVGDIYTMAPDGSSVVRLTFATEWELHPAWSPDGTRIAFVRQIGSAFQVHVMAADGSSVVQVTQAGGSSQMPEWQPAVIVNPPTPGDPFGVLRAEVTATPDSAWRSEGHRNAFSSRLEDIQNLFDDGFERDARQAAFNLRRHIDGCGAVPDRDDWIQDCSVQAELQGLIDDLIVELQSG